MHENTSVTPLELLARGRFWTVLIVAIVLTLGLFSPEPSLRRPARDRRQPIRGLGAHDRGIHPATAAGRSASHVHVRCAALLFELALRRVAARDLVGAGILMGLGWLTKTPALFLVPAGTLLIALELWRSRRVSAQERRRVWTALLGGYVLWAIVAAIVFFLLWPALWVDPIGIFQKMYLEMTAYVGGHITGNFFMGQAVEDPGPLFYPLAYLLRTTPATLLGLVGAAIAALRGWTPFDRPTGRRAGLGLLLFALLFGLFMTFIAKKFDRYLLPSFFVGEILAGLGWAALALWIGRRLASDSRHGVRRVILVALVALLRPDSLSSTSDRTTLPLLSQLLQSTHRGG